MPLGALQQLLVGAQLLQQVAAPLHAKQGDQPHHHGLVELLGPLLSWTSVQLPFPRPAGASMLITAVSPAVHLQLCNAAWGAAGHASSAANALEGKT